jgi:putative membrane protein
MGKAIGVWLITAFAVVAAFTLVGGVGFVGGGYSLNAPGILGSDIFVPTMIFSALLALVNSFVKPILKLITLPITFLSLGLFALILNAMMLYLTSWMANSFFDAGFRISGFFSALVASVIISVVTAILGFITGVDSDRKKSRARR